MITPGWAAKVIDYLDVGYRKWPKVYFIGNSLESPIKIGKSVNVSKRLSSLQTGNPHQLRILATCPEGDVINEIRLHRAYEDARLQGEWFKPVPMLVRIVENLKNKDRLTVAEHLCGESLDLDWMALRVYAYMNNVDHSALEDFQKNLTDDQLEKIVEIKHLMPL